MVCSLMGWTEQEYNCQSWDFVQSLVKALETQYNAKK